MDMTLGGNQPKEVEISAQHETFEAQVLVKTKPYKRVEYPFAISGVYPLEQVSRVIDSGKFKVQLVLSSIQGGKPILIIEEA